LKNFEKEISRILEN